MAEGLEKGRLPSAFFCLQQHKKWHLAKEKQKGISTYALKRKSQYRAFWSVRIAKSGYAAKIANMPQGTRTDLQPSANLPKVISQPEAAKMFNVSERTIKNEGPSKKKAIAT